MGLIFITKGEHRTVIAGHDVSCDVCKMKLGWRDGSSIIAERHDQFDTADRWVFCRQCFDAALATMKRPYECHETTECHEIKFANG
jgi:hypothetical protein